MRVLHDIRGTSVGKTSVSVKQDLAGFKASRSVVFVDQVPRAPNGKADYRRAREYAESPIP